MTQVMTTTALRKNLASALDAVIDNEEELIVPRDDGNAVVLVDLNTWNSMKETLYVLGDRTQTMQLMESMRQLDAGEGFEKPLLDDDDEDAETVTPGTSVPTQRVTA